MTYKVLVDVSIFEDVIRKSKGWKDSSEVLKAVERGEVNGWISSLTKVFLYNLIVKEMVEKTARKLVSDLASSFSEIPLRKSISEKALLSQLPDFNDNIQIESARQFYLDAIVSRNKENYLNSEFPVYSPEEIIGLISQRTDLESGDVPFLDLKAQHHQVYNEIDDRMTDIIANTGFILGKYVEEFEKAFAEIQGAKYCIGVSSGTDALHVALSALDIGPGDSVAVPVNTFIATAEAVSLTGAVPVFIDCDRYYNIDVDKLREVLKQRAGGAEDEKERRAEDEKVRREEGERGRGQRAESIGHSARSMAHGAEGRGQKVRRGENRKSRNGIAAIIPVHLYGQPANMTEIMDLAEEFDVKVVEDCCQAHMAELHGKKLGNFGAFGAFSFYPGKNLGAYGEAGALNTNDEKLFNKAKMIRQHGEIQRYHHKHVGHNYRMSAFQGAVLGVKLKYIEEWTHKRQKCAQIYNNLLEHVEGVKTPREIGDASCVYHLYVIQAEDRNELQQYLQEKGVASGLHYPVPLHLQEAYRELGYRKGDFPVAEEAADKILSLPMYPELTEEQINYVCDKIQRFYRKRAYGRGQRA